MAAASNATLRIDTAAVPLLTGALELAKGNRPGGLASNLEHFEGGVAAAAGIDRDEVRQWAVAPDVREAMAMVDDVANRLGRDRS